MARVIMCDACKTIFIDKRYEYDSLEDRFSTPATSCVKVKGRKFDLCDDCLEEFFEWVGCNK